MQVYRVENLDGCGPYRSAALGGWASNRHPMPYLDGIELGRFDSPRFGFASIEALQQWFDAGMLDNLSECGFVLAVYEVDSGHVQRGGRQCTFECERASRKYRVPLTGETS